MATYQLSAAPWSTDRVPSAVRLTARGRVWLGALPALGLTALTLALLWAALVGSTPAASVAGDGAAAGRAGSDGAFVVAEAVAGRDGAAVHVVERGDTLWDLAAKIDPAADPRPIVDRIKAINGLSDSRLTVGQRLLLPAAAATR